MLVLKRNQGQKVVIGDGVTCPRIVIQLVHCSDGFSRIGIEAPRDVPVWREEILPPEPPAPQPNT